MAEPTWLTRQHTQSLLGQLMGWSTGSMSVTCRPHPLATDRRIRLLACRLLWQHLNGLLSSGPWNGPRAGPTRRRSLITGSGCWLTESRRPAVLTRLASIADLIDHLRHLTRKVGTNPAGMNACALDVGAGSEIVGKRTSEVIAIKRVVSGAGEPAGRLVLVNDQTQQDLAGCQRHSA